ncbi:MAG: hypothetical protein U0992_08725 [Planctomycetaceae bacterium]
MCSINPDRACCRGSSGRSPFSVQIPLFVEHTGLLQAGAMIAGWLAAVILAVRTSDRGVRLAVLLAGSAVFLHVVTVGLHVTKGYWCRLRAAVYVPGRRDFTFDATVEVVQRSRIDR